MADPSLILFPALVSGIISIVVALISAVLTARSQSLERVKQQASLQREMTKLLYEKRLAAYPQALALTEPLRRSRIAAGPADSEYFRAALTELDLWMSGQAGFLVSTSTLKTVYELRRKLRVEAEGIDRRFSNAQIREIEKAKAAFRGSLRADMSLVYGEEFTHENPASPDRVD